MSKVYIVALLTSFVFFGSAGPIFGQGFFTQSLDGIPGGAITTVDFVLTVLNQLACYLIRFAMIAVGFMIVIYGIMFLLSRGNPQGWDRAKRSLGWGIVGGFVIFGVFTIILTVSSLVGYGASGGYEEYPLFSIVTCI